MKAACSKPTKSLFFILLLISVVAIAQESNKQIMLAKNVKTAGATEGTAEVELLVGELNIVADNIDYFSRNECIYYKPKWEPLIEYTVNQEDKEGEFFMSNRHLKQSDYDDDDNCTWNLVFNKDIAMDYTLFLGAGSGKINLSNSNVESLNLEMKAGEAYLDLSETPITELSFKTLAGEATVDLSGTKTNDLHAVIKGGAGDLKLILPNDCRIGMSVSGIIGEIKAPDFQREGRDFYRYPEGSDVTLIIEIKGGVGSVNVQLR